MNTSENAWIESVAGLLETVSDGFILFRDDRAVYANSRAKALIDMDPVGKPLIWLLRWADADLMEHAQGTVTEYSALIGQTWLTMKLHALPDSISVITVREDPDNLGSSDDCKLDVNDMDWLRAISSKLTFLAALADKTDRYPSQYLQTTAQILQTTANQLVKFVRGCTIRSLKTPDEDMSGEPGSFTMDTLLERVQNLLRGFPLPLKVKFRHTEHTVGTIRANPRHIFTAVFGVLSSLIYHCCETGDAPELHPVTISPGETPEHVFLRFTFDGLRPLPLSADALQRLQSERPAQYPPAYGAGWKPVLAVMRLYHGRIICTNNGDHRELILCFEKSAGLLSAPPDFSYDVLSPEIEFSDLPEGPTSHE